MQTPKHITVAVPTLNSASTLEWTLLSLRSQVGCLVDIVVADSGSSDATLDICKRCGVPSIYVPPGNMYRAINAVLRNSQSEWLAYLNSDDCIYPDTFSRLISHAEQNGAAIVYGNCDYVDHQGRFLYSLLSVMPKYLLSFFRYGVFGFAQPAAVFHSSVYQRVNGFDEKYSLSSDVDFYSRAFISGVNFSRLPGASVAFFRLHENQLTSKMSVAMEKEKALIRAVFGPAHLFDHLIVGVVWRLINLPNFVIRIFRKYLLCKYSAR